MGGFTTAPTLEGVNAGSLFGIGVQAKASGSSAWGLSAEASGATGRAVFARATGTTGSSYAVYAENRSASGVGVYVHAAATSGSPTGVHVLHDAAFGQAIRVETTATGGSAGGLHMHIRGTGATGAYVRADGIASNGVRVDCSGAQSTGLAATAADFGVVGNASTSVGAGVQGATTDAAGTGVKGVAVTTTGTAVGVVGESQSPSGYGVFSRGRFGATGSKGFVQPHPEDPTKQIFFVCLEGNENGTYFRGTTRLKNGRVEIAIPDSWRMATGSEGITVQLTPLGKAQLWVEERSRERIVVRGEPDVAFDYFVNGVRRGFSDFQSIEQNRAFVPGERGRPFATGCPPGLRRILVENGILNPDGTPNEATAARLGWTLRDVPRPADTTPGGKDGTP